MKLMDLAKQMQDPHEPAQVRYWGARIEAAIRDQADAFESEARLSDAHSALANTSKGVLVRAARARSFEDCARDLLATTEGGE